MDSLPASRAEAAKSRSKWYFTGKPCAHGHMAPRFTSVGTCKECAKVRAKELYRPTTDRKRAYDDQASFVLAVRSKHGDRYLYDAVKYAGAHAKVDIRCQLHGLFSQTPTNHMQGRGCPKCKHAALGQAAKKTTQGFVQTAHAVWGDRWGYDQVVYDGAHTKVRLECHVHGCFSQTPTNHLTGKLACPKCNHMVSKGEQEVMQFVQKFGYVVQRDRTIIGPRELDIYLPSARLAIEYCGEYWHSSGSKQEEDVTRMRHFEKYSMCKEQEIRLLTIFESEWRNHGHAIRRLIRGALGKIRGKLMARQCDLGLVTNADARAFYDLYHPQGGSGNGEHYGLFWKGRLVACMRFSFGANDRGKARKVWTLSRYATRVTVTGGASRLFAAFLRKRNPQEVKSFSDNRFFNGGMYPLLGFSLDGELSPDYQVWSPKKGLRPKTHYQRAAIQKRLQEHGVDEVFDAKTDSRPEAQMTYLMGCRRLYDCGKKRWIWRVDHNFVQVP